jgi:hypothetical protein
MNTSLISHRSHSILISPNLLLKILNFHLFKSLYLLKTKIFLINSFHFIPPFLLYSFHLFFHLTNLFIYLYILIFRIIILFWYKSLCHFFDFVIFTNLSLQLMNLKFKLIILPFCFFILLQRIGCLWVNWLMIFQSCLLLHFLSGQSFLL